jgi:BMFP domain-containing protein YqiC
MNDVRTKIVDDVGNLLSGLGIAAQGVREEVEQAISAQMDRLISDASLVTREEFEAVRDMAMAARAENQALKAALDALVQQKNK